MAVDKEDLEDTIDLLSRGHELNFNYKDGEYVIQPETVRNENNIAIACDFVFYMCKPEFVYLSRIRIPEKNRFSETGWEVTRPIVEKMFNEKCLDGKSIMELLDEIKFTYVF